MSRNLAGSETRLRCRHILNILNSKGRVWVEAAISLTTRFSNPYVVFIFFISYN